MPKKELSENDKYRNKHYPNLYPCKECYYWRSGGGGNTKKNMVGSFAMCHYNLWNDELRGSYPDYINGTCDKFLPRNL